MNYINIVLMILCGLFYALLCIFSIVTGLIYALGKRELNPLELSNKMIKKLNTVDKKEKFAKKMGVVTFIVGIVQGITSISILRSENIIFYYIAIGFTIFSLASVLFKLNGKISIFPILKGICYIIILIVLILNKQMFF